MENKCIKCGTNSVNHDEMCENCYKEEKEIEESNTREKEQEKIYDYTKNYTTTILVFSIIILITGIVLAFVFGIGSGEGKPNTVVAIVIWGCGSLFITFLVMLKDIINELRKINEKLK